MVCMFLELKAKEATDAVTEEVTINECIALRQSFHKLQHAKPVSEEQLAEEKKEKKDLLKEPRGDGGLVGGRLGGQRDSLISV